MMFGSPAAPTSAIRILVLTDDAVCANFIAEALAPTGAAVRSLSTGESVLTLLETVELDALIIDLALPTMNPFEVIRRLRDRAGTRLMPIHALGSGVSSLAEKAMIAGATSVLSPGGGLAAQIDELREELALPQGLAVPASREPLLAAVVRSAPELLAASRKALQSLVRNRRDLAAVQHVARCMGMLARQAELVELRAVHRLAAALEALLYAIDDQPGRMGATTIQTISQACDFLGHLMADRKNDSLPDPRGSEVFVLDDDADARNVVTMALNYAGLSGTSAGDPATALALLARQHFDLLFFDVNVPGMSGFELCARLRRLPMNARSPVVFITGEPSLQNRAQSTIIGGSDFIAKPFSITELSVKAILWVVKGRIEQQA